MNTNPKFDAQALGDGLTDVAHDRARFDALLNKYGVTYKAAELKAIAHCFMGYEVNKTKTAF
jgi:hypothetical protein